MLLSAQIPTRVSSVAIYITPTIPKIPCPSNDLCMNLSEYSHSNDKRNNTELVLLPGEHVLNRPLLFKNLENVSLSGVWSSYVLLIIEFSYDSGSSGSITFDTTSNFIISNIMFSGCQKQISSTVSIIQSRNISIINSKFSGSAHSGGLFFEFCTDVMVCNTHFIGNHNTNGGGALFIVHSNIQIIDCVFTNNSANYGGAIYAGDSVVKLQSSHFLNNMAMNGGALSILSGFLSISKSFFDHNEALKYGGSLYYFKDYTLVINDSKFINGKALSGAAIILYEGNTLLYNCSFVNNSASSGGGALYTRNAVMTIELSVLTLNFAYEGKNSFQNINFGGAMYIDNGSAVSVKQSQFLGNYAHGYGGAIHSSINTSLSAYGTYFGQNYNLNADCGGGALSLSGIRYIFVNCSFVENEAVRGGAILNNFAKWIHIESCIFKGNTGWTGGALHTCKLCRIQLDDTEFNRNTAQIGGAIYAQGSIVNSSGYLTFTNNSCLNHGVAYFHHCDVKFYGQVLFVNNKGSLFSFATGITFMNGAIFHQNEQPLSYLSDEGGAVTFIESSVFIYGKFLMSYNMARFGGAMYISNSDIFAALNSQFEVANNTALFSGAAIYCIQAKLTLGAKILIKGNNALQNGGGIMASSSTIVIMANQLKLAHNRAKYGGGMYLQNSLLIIQKNVPQILPHYFLDFSENTADYGGAVFVNDDSNSGVCSNNSTTRNEVNCFLQILRTYSLSDLRNQSPPAILSASLSNNTARYGGNSIYGGLLDRCALSIFSEFRAVYPNMNYKNAVSILNVTMSLEDIDSISSDPVRVCFCEKESLNCNYEHSTIYVRRGHPFNISLIAVDQVLNALPANILVSVSSIAGLDQGQTNQTISAECTELEYSVYSPNNVEEMVLYAEGPCMGKGISQRNVKLYFEPCTCAIGFQPSNSSSSCECVCDNRIRSIVTNCTSNRTVNKQNDFWFTFSNETIPNGFLIYKYCPYDYCLSTFNVPIPINLNVPNGADMQCAFNRSGKLCGSCIPGHSLTFGSSKCLKCTNSYLALLVVFAIAGIVLVLFLLTFNMTVATGTINGLIFYANIVIANRSAFLPDKMPAVLSVFIAWINLDLGIETCFYNGMDMHAKTLLQVVFPTYVLTLVVILIFICKYSKRFAALIGKRNPVAALATLVILSFTKFIRVIITGLSFGHLKLPDGTSDTIWMPDGNVLFLATDHLFRLIVVAIITMVGLGYVLLLLLEKRCRRYSKLRLMKYLNNTKLHGFMDAYYAPLNPQHCYWVGLLLLARITLYMHAIGFNSEPTLEHKATLLAIIGTVFFLLLLKQLRVRVYKNWIIDLLETSFLVNLGIFAAGTYHILSTETRGKQLTQLVLASISVSIATLTFLVTCLYHMYTFLIPNSPLKRCLQKCVRNCTQRNAVHGRIAAVPHDYIPYTALEDVRGNIAQQTESYGDLREPDLDILAPLTEHDWKMENEPPPAPQPLKNVVTYSVIERRPPVLH